MAVSRGEVGFRCLRRERVRDLKLDRTRSDLAILDEDEMKRWLVADEVRDCVLQLKNDRT